MRLDLFLKWSRIITRRTLAKQTCDAGRVAVNDHAASAGREVRADDTVTVRLPRRVLKVRIRSIPAHALGRENAREMIEILEDRRID